MTTELAQSGSFELVTQALQNGAGADQVQSIIELVKFRDEREAKQSFNRDFTRAQSEFPAVFRKRKAHNSSYAGFSDVVDAIRPVLIKHGLSFRHDVKEEGGRISVTCHLAHEDGHSESATLSGPPDDSGKKNAVQAIASTVTYLKRYTLEAVTGVVTTDDDNDGGAPVETISEQQAVQLQATMESEGRDIAKLLVWAGVDKLSDLTLEQHAKAVQTISRGRK